MGGRGGPPLAAVALGVGPSFGGRRRTSWGRGLGALEGAEVQLHDPEAELALRLRHTGTSVTGIEANPGDWKGGDRRVKNIGREDPRRR